MQFTFGQSFLKSYTDAKNRELEQRRLDDEKEYRRQTARDANARFKKNYELQKDTYELQKIKNDFDEKQAIFKNTQDVLNRFTTKAPEGYTGPGILGSEIDKENSGIPFNPGATADNTRYYPKENIDIFNESIKIDLLKRAAAAQELKAKLERERNEGLNAAQNANMESEGYVWNSEAKKWVKKKLPETGPLDQLNTMPFLEKLFYNAFPSGATHIGIENIRRNAALRAQITDKVKTLEDLDFDNPKEAAFALRQIEELQGYMGAASDIGIERSTIDKFNKAIYRLGASKDIQTKTIRNIISSDPKLATSFLRNTTKQ